MSRFGEWWRGLRRAAAPALTVESPDLRIVVEAFDSAEADSAALARSPAWRATEPAVLRHHLRLPIDQVGAAEAILEQDHWTIHRQPAEQGKPEDVALVTASRVQLLDALHCAQERARMAGLAQRLGGDALGWDAAQPLSGTVQDGP